MRLLIELVIIAALIFFGWNTPFKDSTAQAYTKINSAFDSLGGSLQKNQDPSVKRY
jgi:predicted negative regulator of RcsB-dependent stress response